MSDMTVMMPLTLTQEMILAVREDPTTRVDDLETWHARLGWLLCAWDVMVSTRLTHEKC